MNLRSEIVLTNQTLTQTELFGALIHRWWNLLKVVNWRMLIASTLNRTLEKVSS